MYLFKLKDVHYEEILYIEELDIPDKKVTCIVGESGSGKSTLIKLLNNLISHDSGEILYKDQSLTSFDPVQLRRKVVMVPQSPAIFEGTIKDNLLIGLEFSEKPPADDENLKNVLKLVHLQKTLEEDADLLSGGEKQRLALAIAFLLDPEVYILDEPTSGLDEETEDMVIGNVVRQIKLKKKTLIMVTHSKKIAKMFGENVIELKDGILASTKEIHNG